MEASEVCNRAVESRLPLSALYRKEQTAINEVNTALLYALCH
jgi:hypothetical protein